MDQVIGNGERTVLIPAFAGILCSIVRVLKFAPRRLFNPFCGTFEVIFRPVEVCCNEVGKFGGVSTRNCTGTV